MATHATQINFTRAPEFAIFAECKCGWQGTRYPGELINPNAYELAEAEASWHESSQREGGAR